MAEMYSLVKEPSQAAETRRRAIKELVDAGELNLSDAVEGFAAIATDLRNSAQYAEALNMVHRAGTTLMKHAPLDHPKGVTGGADGSSAISSSTSAAAAASAASLGILAKLESSILSCMGDDVEALSRFEDALKLLHGHGRGQHGWVSESAASQSMDIDERLTHMDLLLRAASFGDAAPDAHERLAFGDNFTASSRKTAAAAVQAGGQVGAVGGGGDDAAGEPLPLSLRRKMEAAARKQALSLISAGPWKHPLQLPKTYLPGLAARPWHDVAQHFPELQPLQALLERSTVALRSEYLKLSKRKLLYPEDECIHDAGGGAWRHYSINGFWLARDASGCSSQTPEACRVLEEATALGIPGLIVLRAGYSSIASKGRLRPHCGTTNAQLKFHLGLITPKDPETGLPCASIRVGNETRAWEAGKTLFFDDSFLHSVANTCTSGRERVVFQFVIVHPDVNIDQIAKAATSRKEKQREEGGEDEGGGPGGGSSSSTRAAAHSDTASLDAKEKALKVLNVGQH